MSRRRLEEGTWVTLAPGHGDVDPSMWRTGRILRATESEVHLDLDDSGGPMVGLVTMSWYVRGDARYQLAGAIVAGEGYGRMMVVKIMGNPVRVQQRENVRVSVADQGIQVVIGWEVGARETGLMLDLSAGGALITTGQLRAPGDQAVLEFTLDSGRPFALQAEVARLVPLPAVKDSSGLGFAFTHLGFEDLTQITGWVLRRTARPDNRRAVR